MSYVSIHFVFRPKNGINIAVTSNAEISMDAFDRQWKTFTRRSNFFQQYNVHHMKWFHELELQSWYETVLRSQFDNSQDPHDKLSLIHWTMEIGNTTDFILDTFTVPFYAIIKTPTMEYWYTHANVDNELNRFTAQARRMPQFEEHEVIQPYYHTRLQCSAFNRCNQLRNCYNKLVSTSHEIMFTEFDRLAEEVF